ncbi:MAG TPA: magnesium/cobalt transporter CorA [Actinomycetota bacterium]|jgi:magnesium transporter|nr:magnesium/cobalt transporter CorA [Actinomycetota bacterium]
MVTTRLYRGGTLVEEGFDPQKVSDFLEDEKNMVWLDLEDPSEQELNMMEEEFSIHPLAIEDARHRDQRPKIERFEALKFLVFYGMAVEEGRVLEGEIQAFVAPRFLITLRFPPAFDLEPTAVRAQENNDLAAEGAGFFLYAVLDAVVDRYFDVVDHFEDESETIEEEVFSEDTSEDVQKRIFHLRKRVMTFRRRLSPLRDVLQLLQGDSELVTRPLEAYYRDVTDHVIRTIEFVDNLRDLLTSALEAHLAQVSNRLNEVMKALTSWAAIILVPTLIAGVYGMNFRHVPELNWLYGYPFALGLMAVTATGLYWMFKRRGWL